MEQQHWLTRSDTIRKLWRFSIIVLVAIVLAEFFIPNEPHFSVERVFGFNAWFGFGACAVLILFAKAIGILIKRPDSYYDDDERDA